MRKQLNSWYVSDYVDDIPQGLLQIYRLAGGEFVHKNGPKNGPTGEEMECSYSDSIFTSKNKNENKNKSTSSTESESDARSSSQQQQQQQPIFGWERCLSAIFWYGGSTGGSIQEMVSDMEGTPQPIYNNDNENTRTMGAALRHYRNAVYIGGIVDEPVAECVKSSSHESKENERMNPSESALTHQDGLFSVLDLLLTEGNHEEETELTQQQCIEALKSEGYSADPLDYRAPYVILVLLECLGFQDNRDKQACVVRQHYVQQLMDLQQWKWAVFVSLQIADDSVRTSTAKNVIFRWAGSPDWEVQGAGTGGNGSNGSGNGINERFLRDELKIPVSWLHEATAYRCAQLYSSPSPSSSNSNIHSVAEVKLKYLLSAAKTCGAQLTQARTLCTPACSSRKEGLRLAAVEIISQQIMPVMMLRGADNADQKLLDIFQEVQAPTQFVGDDDDDNNNNNMEQDRQGKRLIQFANINVVNDGSTNWDDHNSIYRDFFAFKMAMKNMKNSSAATGPNSGQESQHKLQEMRNDATVLLKRIGSTMSASADLLRDNVRDKKNDISGERETNTNTHTPQSQDVASLDMGSALSKYIQRLLSQQNMENMENDDANVDIDIEDLERQHCHAQLDLVRGLQSLPRDTLLDTYALGLARTQTLCSLREMAKQQ